MIRMPGILIWGEGQCQLLPLPDSLQGLQCGCPAFLGSFSTHFA